MIFVLVLFLFAFALSYYVILKCKYNYWSGLGVQGPLPIPFIGNFAKVMAMKESIGEIAFKTYQDFPNEKIVGLYCGFRKVIVLRDPDIIQHILVRDFKNFVNRGIRTTENGFCNNLLAAEDEIWKCLRHTLSPTFTGTKLKQMMPLIQECVEKLIAEIETRNTFGKNNHCDIKELCEKYALDVISSCIFGLGVDVYSSEIKHFRKVSETALKPSLYFWLFYVIEMIFPGIQNKLPFLNPGSYLRRFFTELITTVINERAAEGIKRNDFMNIMIELKKNHELNSVDNAKLKIDDNVIASQAFAFYVAGQDTSSRILSFMLYELSLNQDIQDKVYEEIKGVSNVNNGNLTYESLKDLKYLNMVLKETMRKHTAVSFIIRKSSEDYDIPGTNIKLQSDTIVLISLTGLHSDAKYFDNIEQFNPDNFSEANSTKIPHYAYLPYGSGHRNCIGYRLAELQIFMAAVNILKKYKLEACNDIKHKIKYINSVVALAPETGICISISKR